MTTQQRLLQFVASYCKLSMKAWKVNSSDLNGYIHMIETVKRNQTSEQIDIWNTVFNKYSISNENWEDVNEKM